MSATQSEKKKTLKVETVVSNVAKSKAAKKQKAIEEKMEKQAKELAPRPNEIRTSSGRISNAGKTHQVKLNESNPKRPKSDGKKGENPENQYIETVILSGEEFSVAGLSKELNMSFQNVRARVLRIAKQLGKTVKIASRGTWKAE